MQFYSIEARIVTKPIQFCFPSKQTVFGRVDHSRQVHRNWFRVELLVAPPCVPVGLKVPETMMMECDASSSWVLRIITLAGFPFGVTEDSLWLIHLLVIKLRLSYLVGSLVQAVLSKCQECQSNVADLV